MRVAQKFPTDGPHAPIGHGAPKKLLEEIERRLSIVKYIKCEPLLMNPDNEHACEGTSQGIRSLVVHSHCSNRECYEIQAHLSYESCGLAQDTGR